MDRKWQSGAAVSPPALDNDSDGYATNGNPGTGTPPTVPGAHWFHMVTEEQLAVILAAGLTPDKTNVAQMIAAMNLLYDSQGIVPGGRLTLTTGVPVTTSDVSAATTVYYTPYEHDRIKLYDGTRWKWYTFTEMSQALSDTTKSPAAAAANKVYDMFVWDDNGTLRCTRGPLWSSNTARGTGAATTELEQFQGRWVNKQAISNGPAARRGLYIGSIATNDSSQTNDSLINRHVWNRFNRIMRPMFRVDSTLSWTYNTAAYRQANANVSNQLDILIGLSEDPVRAEVVATATNTTSLGAAVPGIGLDSTTVNAAQLYFGAVLTTNPLTPTPLAAIYRGIIPIGRHTLVWLEDGHGSGGTTTWYGNNPSNGHAAGIAAEVMG